MSLKGQIENERAQQHSSTAGAITDKRSQRSNRVRTINSNSDNVVKLFNEKNSDSSEPFSLGGWRHEHRL